MMLRRMEWRDLAPSCVASSIGRDEVYPNLTPLAPQERSDRSNCAVAAFPHFTAGHSLSPFGIVHCRQESRGQLMGYTLEQFSADCHRILAADPGPQGRKQVCALVQKACADEAFVRQHLPD